MATKRIQDTIEQPAALEDDEDLLAAPAGKDGKAPAKAAKEPKEEPAPVDPASWAEERGFLATWNETDAIPDPPGDVRGELTAAELLLLTVDPGALNAQLAELPTIIASVCANLADVTANLEASKGQIARLKGALDASYRATTVKPTEKLIEAKVSADGRVAVAQERARALYACKDRLWGLLEGLRKKHESLLAIGQNLRAELGNHPGVVRTPTGT